MKNKVAVVSLENQMAAESARKIAKDVQETNLRLRNEKKLKFQLSTIDKNYIDTELKPFVKNQQDHMQRINDSLQKQAAINQIFDNNKSKISITNR